MATPKLLLCGSFLPPQTNFALNLAASYQAFPLLTLGVGPAAQLITCTFWSPWLILRSSVEVWKLPAPTL